MKPIITPLLLISLSSMLSAQTPFQRSKASNYTAAVQHSRDTTLIVDVGTKRDVNSQLTGTQSDTLSWLQKQFNRLSLAQSFQSRPEKDKAATLNLVFPKDTVSSQNFSFAIGYNVLPENGSVSLKPFYEWQKNTLAAKKQNTVLTGLNFQGFLLNQLRGPSIYSIAAVNYKNDRIKSSKGTQASLYLTPIFPARNGKFIFLPDAVMHSKAIEAVYNVYGGAEYENRRQAKDDTQNGTLFRWYGRITGFFYPLPDMLRKRIEIIPDYSIRSAWANHTTSEANTNRLWKLTANFILLSKEQSKFADIKIGYDYVNGADPTTGFEKQQISMVSFKIKI